MSNDFNIQLGVAFNQKDIDKEIKEIEKILKSKKFKLEIDTTAIKELVTQIKEVSKMPLSADNGQGLLNMTKATHNSLKDVKGALGEVQKATKATAQEQERYNQTVGNLAVKVAVFNTLTQLFYKFTGALKDGIDYTIELDGAMTSLKKVADELTDPTAFINFTEEISQTAIAVGKSSLEAISATTNWKQLGLSIEEATKQAEKSLIFSNISDQDISKSTKELVAILAGFEMDYSQTDRIIDALNEAGNKTTSTTADIGEGLLKSSAALNIANNSLEESIGLMVAGNAAIQNANVVGTGLKTVSMRLRGVADDEGVIISGLQKKVKELANVDVMLADKVTFKSTFQILKEISEEFKGLSDIKQADLLELLFGKNQAQVGASILLNFNQALDATGYAINSAGSAAKEQEAYMTSLNAKVNELSETIKKAFSDNLGKEFLADTIDGMKELVETFGNAPTVIMAVVTAFAAIKGVSVTKSIVETTSSITSSISEMYKYQTALKTGSSAVNVAKQGQIALATATGLAKSGWEALKASFMANPFVYITTAILAVVTAVDMYNQAQRKVRQEALETVNANTTKIQQLKDLQSQYESIIDSTNTETEKTKDLDAWKKTLVETYGFEEEALKKVNLERKTGIDLINEEILATANDTIRTLGGEYETAKEEMSAPQVGLTIAGIDTTELVDDLNKANVAFTDTGRSINFVGDSLTDYKESLGRAIDVLNKKTDRTKEEEFALKELRTEYNKVNTQVKENTDVMKQYEQAFAIVNVASSNIGSDADFDKFIDGVKNSSEYTQTLKDEIIKLANNAFPQFSDATKDEVEQISSLSSSLNDLSSDIDSHAAKLEDLEKTIEKVNEGYHFSYSEIEKIKELYPELNAYITRTTNGWQIQAGAIDKLSTGVRFTTDEIKRLKTLYPGLIKVTDDGTGVFYLEKDALDAVGQSSLGLKATLIEAQIEMTKQAILSSSDRISTYASEIEAIENLADAYAVIAKMKNQAQSDIKKSYDESGLNYDNWMLDTDGFIADGEKDIIALGEYSEQLATIKDKVANLSAGSVSGSGSKSNGSGGSGSSKKQTEVKNIELDNLLLLEKKYKDIENQLETIQHKKDDISLSTEEQISLAQQEVDLLKQQQNIQHQMAEQRRADIQPQLAELNKYGVEVEFNPKLNQLEFKQSVSEIEDTINSVNLGDVEKSNELKESLKGYISEVIKLNEANMDAGKTWQELEEKKQEAFLTENIVVYNKSINDSTEAIEDLDKAYGYLEDNQINEKVSNLNSQFNEQVKIANAAADKIYSLNKLHADGAISLELYTVKLKEFTDEQKNALGVLKDLDIDKKNLVDTVIDAYYDYEFEQRQNEINALKKQLDDIEDRYKSRISLIDKEIDLLKDKNDLQKKEEDRQKRLLDIEKLRLELENTRNEKNIRQLTKKDDGLYDFEYVVDQSKIDSLEEQIQSKYADLNSANADDAYDAQVKMLENSKAALEDQMKSEKDTLNSKIDVLQDFLDKEKKIYDDRNKFIVTSAEQVKELLAGVNVSMYAEQLAYLEAFNDSFSKLSVNTVGYNISSKQPEPSTTNTGDVSEVENFLAKVRKIQQDAYTLEQDDIEVSESEKIEMRNKSVSTQEDIEDQKNKKLLEKLQKFLAEVLSRTKSNNTLLTQAAQQLNNTLINLDNTIYSQRISALTAFVNSWNAEIARMKQASMASNTSVDGSHAEGLKRVPWDGYVAELHENERVLTEDEAKKYARIEQQENKVITPDGKTLIPYGSSDTKFLQTDPLLISAMMERQFTNQLANQANMTKYITSNSNPVNHSNDLHINGGITLNQPNVQDHSDVRKSIHELATMVSQVKRR